MINLIKKYLRIIQIQENGKNNFTNKNNIKEINKEKILDKEIGFKKRHIIKKEIKAYQVKVIL